MCTLEPNISQLHCVRIACIKIKLELANVRFLLKLQQQALLPKEKLKITIIYNILIQTKVMFAQNN